MLSSLFPHALQLAVDQSIDVAAISVRVGDEIQQALDIDQRHVQRSAMTDEGQLPDVVLLAVFPVAISPGRCGGNNPDFVVADGVDLHSGWFRQFADG